MLLRILHVAFALIVILLIAGAAFSGWNDLPAAPLVLFAVGSIHLWYVTWRNLTDLRKEELLDKVESIEEDDQDGPEVVLDHPGSSHAPQPTDGIQAGVPASRAENASVNIRRI